MNQKLFPSALALAVSALLSCSPLRADQQPIRPLDRYQIPRTKDALVAALHHPDGGVRVEAAFGLAFVLKAKDSMPAILAALRAESVPMVRTGLASAAAGLGSTEALDTLRFMCVDSKSSSLSRAEAAAAMYTFLERQECLGSLFDVLRLRDDSQALFVALNVIGNRVGRLSGEELDQVRALGAVLLNSDHSEVRWEASHVLAKFGDAASLSQLKVALAAEEIGYRGIIAADIEALASKLSQPQQK